MGFRRIRSDRMNTLEYGFIEKVLLRHRRKPAVGEKIFGPYIAVRDFQNTFRRGNAPYTPLPFPKAMVSMVWGAGAETYYEYWGT